MKFQGITIVSDMDGTLLNEEKHISQKNLDAIRYFQEQGGNFTIASGRVYQSVASYFDVLCPSLPVISHNGSVMVNPQNHEILYCKCLTGNYHRVATEIHEKFPWLGMEAFTPKEILFFYDNPYVRKHISDEKIFPDNQIVWHNLEKDNSEWCKILFACEKDEADMLEQELPPLYPEYHFVRSDANYFEMMSPAVNKGTALRELMKICNISREKCYALGDNMNDAELLEAAGIGIAVQNASDALKNRADIVLPCSNNEDAICCLIEQIEKGTI